MEAMMMIACLIIDTLKVSSGASIFHAEGDACVETFFEFIG
jgi:hypothetical protein